MKVYFVVYYNRQWYHFEDADVYVYRIKDDAIHKINEIVTSEPGFYGDCVDENEVEVTRNDIINTILKTNYYCSESDECPSLYFYEKELL